MWTSYADIEIVSVDESRFLEKLDAAEKQGEAEDRKSERKRAGRRAQEKPQDKWDKI